MHFSRHQHTYEEYLQLENASSTKHEYLNGDIVAMAGGSPDHAAIAANVIAALNVQLRGKPCRVFTADLRIRIEAANVATYPDVSVVCGPVQLDPKDDKGHTITNPIVLVEVLSPSTHKYDTGEKLEYYKRIPSLQEVVLVDWEQQRLAVWRRAMGGAFWAEETTSGAAQVRSIGCELSLEDVYRNDLPAD